MAKPPPTSVYLDHNATTPVRPEVLDAMLPVLRDVYGNPNSVHTLGQRARKAVEAAREQVASLLNAAAPDEIVFTSCGSESDVLALCGAAQHAYNRSAGAKNRVITSNIEHEAVLGAARSLAARGFTWTAVDADRSARVDPAAVREVLADDVAVLSVMLANNEVGTLQPVRQIAGLCRERGVVSHTDAVQAVGKIAVDVQALGVDLLALSGHKLNAPKGVGALYVRGGVPLSQVVTGHQERNRRGGTENTASIVGLGKAAELARQELSVHARAAARLRDRLESSVLALGGVRLTCEAPERLPGTAHFCFQGIEGHHLVVALDLAGICVSGGPACVAGAAALSHVLKAMGVPPATGRGALRVSVGWGSTDADVDRFLQVLPKALNKLRTAS